jgi:hypothetical protein
MTKPKSRPARFRVFVIPIRLFLALQPFENSNENKFPVIEYRRTTRQQAKPLISLYSFRVLRKTMLPETIGSQRSGRHLPDIRQTI